MTISITCDDCNDEISQNGNHYCDNCFDERGDQIKSLKDQVSNLEEEVKELEIKLANIEKEEK